MNDVPDAPGEPRNASDPPLHRLNEYIAFTPSEVDRIRALSEKPVALSRSTVIREQGVTPTCLFLLLDGWASASVDFEDGSRQIAKVHLPGDVMGAPSISMALTAETLTALTRVVVSRVPLARFGRLFAASPRFAAAMFLGAQRERIALMDAMTRIGRTSSAERLAALLLDLYGRLSAAGRVEGPRFELPLTQEQIADVIGITPVHVNRTFKTLEETNLVQRSRHQIEITDQRGLARYARWSHRPIATELDWLTGSGTP